MARLAWTFALVCVCLWSQAAGDRTLLQGLFDCGGIKQMGKSASDNRCCQLCWCIGDFSDKKALAADAIQKMCKQECSKCVAAGYDTKQCPSDKSNLPPVCANGLQFSSAIKGLVDKCLDAYRKEPARLNKVPGC